MNKKSLYSWTPLISLAVICCIAAVQAIFSYRSHIPYWQLFSITTIALVVSWSLLRLAGRTYLAALFGACIIACSSWVPLFFIAPPHTGGEQLSLRDAFVDPNQISVSHAAGGYIGVPGAFFAIVGISVWIGMLIHRRDPSTNVDSIIAGILFVALFITFYPSPVAYPRLIPIVVIGIAWFASLGLDRTQRFLGTKDTFAQILIGILVAISIADIMHIAARTLMYGLGI